MAGRERNGFVMSDADLFLGASFILTPCGAAAEAVAELKRTTMPLGFSASVETTPEDHDRLIAFTSQVPHEMCIRDRPNIRKPTSASESGAIRPAIIVTMIGKRIRVDLLTCEGL